MFQLRTGGHGIHDRCTRCVSDQSTLPEPDPPGVRSSTVRPIEIVDAEDHCRPGVDSSVRNTGSSIRFVARAGIAEYRKPVFIRRPGPAQPQTRQPH
jgi:hypothetical protein